MRDRLNVLFAAGLLVAAISPGSPAAAREEGAVGPGATAPAADVPVAVTLVTGDRVLLRDETGGKRSVTFEPAEGRDAIGVHQVDIDGDLYLFPSDVLPYLSEDRLDRAMFNIDALVAEGYDDASLDSVPLIATTSGSTRSLSALTGADQGEPLESIDGRALSVDKEEASAFWESVTDAARSRLAAGVQKLWLDGKVEAALERSVAQIGAPDRLGGRVRRHRRHRRGARHRRRRRPPRPGRPGGRRGATSPRATPSRPLRARHPRRRHDRRHRRGLRRSAQGRGARGATSRRQGARTTTAPARSRDIIEGMEWAAAPRPTS